MYLPNSERAVVEMEKPRDYALNSDHPRGKHKARVFEAALGITREDVPRLREMLLTAALTDQAELGERDEYGQRYTLEFSVIGLMGFVNVFSAWIVRSDEDFPRLVTCYVL